MFAYADYEGVGLGWLLDGVGLSEGALPSWLQGFVSLFFASHFSSSPKPLWLACLLWRCVLLLLCLDRIVRLRVGRVLVCRVRGDVG